MIIGKNASNSPPKDIEQFYLHKENTNATMKNTEAEILFEPIVAVKNYSRGFQRVHVSFQSTTSCNIAYVKALNECTTFVDLNEKVRGKNKR